jgi:histidinol dehydrogenase
MGAIPAKIAGVANLVASFAAGIDGPNPLLMGTAFAAGVDQVVTVGGPQAVIALAVGTQTVPKVDLIVGPGGQRVTVAKALVSALGLVGIDMLAGPSEVCIIVDGSTPVMWTAADLLSQMEHGGSSSAYLICDRLDLINEARLSVENLLREHKFNASMSQLIGVLVKDEVEAMAIVNLLAPEHLLIQTRDPEISLARLQSAGSVFLGPYSAEAFGDYASGTNHVLPTSGQARTRGGLSVNDFQKRISVQKVSAEGAKELAPHVELLAGEEGLYAHRLASIVRR